MLKESVVYTGGTFDLFHWGHAELLRSCAELGKVTVALNTDDFIEKFKGQKPICTYEERARVLMSCKWVHQVVPNLSGQDSKPTILNVKPDYIVVGSDWMNRDYYAQMSFTKEWLDLHSIKLVYLPYSIGVSSTELKRRMRCSI
jgi:glycerol-3-phosphate cytidylyltransferase